MSTPDPTLSSAERLALIKEKCQGLAEPFRSAYTWIPDGIHVPNQGISYWITVPWHNHDGRATLAGDAAHPLPPHRGQGLNHCIADVEKLVEALKGVRTGSKTLPEAIDGYDKEVVARGAAEVQDSKANALAVLDWKRMMESPLFKSGLARQNH